MKKLTTDEKIDYIYKHIRWERRQEFISRLTKWAIWISIISIAAYFYFIGYDKMKADIIESITPEIPSIESINTDKILEKTKKILDF